jgi:lysophospholipase L1-like esterase
VNPAIGGTQLRQGLIQMPRWLIETPSPDLVTICYGGNDWDAGMRGPQFEQTLRDGIDQLHRVTSGKTSLLILSTVPSVQRWDTTSELADACRAASKEKDVGLADLQKAFHLAGKTDRERLFVNDKVHLSLAGHELVAKTVLEAIEGE